jgi:transcriptional regulator with XRE-family HTH domain
MNSDKKGVAKRLTEFGEERFGSDHGAKAKFAEALEISPQQLQNLLRGRSGVGARTQERLRALGCDIEWLMTGKDSQTKKELAQFVRDHPGSVSTRNTRGLPEGISPLG